jgi:hypothetical protein
MDGNPGWTSMDGTTAATAATCGAIKITHRTPRVKILILIILLNAQTGDIEKGAIIGTAPDSATCMQVAAKAIDNTKDHFGGRVPFPVCIDIEPMIPTKT